jgi:cobalt/nickel transport system ATP-binding protein
MDAMVEIDGFPAAREDGGAAVPASLEVEGLAFAYPDGHQALFGVDLRIGRGERVALLGPNGAGKTTLVMHLNGILSADTGTGQGTVRVAGLEVAKRNLQEIRRRVGIVFQDPDDQLFMPTVREDVAFGPANLGLRGAELDARVAEALEQVGMTAFADRPPHHLSFGQRRRVAVATVLAMRPEILVLDEPSSNLDPASRRELAEILARLDVTVLMVTHDLPYALELCPRALILSGGVIAADGPTRELLADRELREAHRLELPYGYALPDCERCAPQAFAARQPG